MSLHLYAENNDGDIVEVPGRLREDTLEVVQLAAEGAVGDSTIVLDDPDGDFYIRGHKPLYLVETAAIDDDWFGLIGIFYSWTRTFRRGNYRTDAGREVHISVKDVNTLWTRRVQKGGDAKREQETDVERIVDWLSNTAEFVGGTGDAGFAVEDRDFMFSDSPYQMSETDYTSQDSAGVINDALQDSGKNAYLFPSPTDSEYVRVGMWYGRSERTDFSSPHRISNFLSDISTETLDAAWMFDPTLDYIEGLTFAPSIDSSLERDPSRVASGVMVMADGSYAYVTNPATRDAFTARDMVMQAELVKTQAQAERRASRYVRDLRNEDDAITTAVLVPSALVNAFVQGQRVQFRCSYMPGYSADFVWLRVASRTVRQVSADSGLYELALDLRAEEPPDSATTGTGTSACSAQTASNNFHPLGGTGDVPNPSDGHSFYWNPGVARPLTPAEAVALADHQHWHFPDYGSGGAATTDAAGDCAQNRVRCLVEGAGTMTIHTSEYAGQGRTLRAILQHHRYGDAEEGSGPTAGVDIIDEILEGAAGSDFEFDITTHGGENCAHWVDVSDIGGTCGSKWGYDGFDWVAA